MVLRPVNRHHGQSLHPHLGTNAVARKNKTLESKAFNQTLEEKVCFGLSDDDSIKGLKSLRGEE